MSREPDFDIRQVDEVIHGRIRLAVMAYLSAVSPASFPELTKKTGTTNGNLSTHLTKLEGANYVELEKGYKGKRPQTLVHMTETGRKAWLNYLSAMRDIIGL
ncbi:MAG: winged helix-turn-helix domain-containing protein [Litorimonas sp.]